VLDGYAREGLRTLMVAYREVPKVEYEKWKAAYHTAETSLQDRSGKMAACQDEIEVKLKLLGAAALEDKLQDGVVDAIECLRRAGIKVWVLTGDKVDTAVTISTGAALITDDMHILKLCAEDKLMAVDSAGLPIEQAIRQQLQEVSAEGRKYGSSAGSGGQGVELSVVVDTAALESIWKYNLNEQFADLCAMCKSVVCARVTPDQKGKIVSMVKNSSPTGNKMDAPICLAIGDGANDVNMIQNAHVGVGIAGLEGLQAVNASDYAIGQFRFLKRLLLVHGRWSARRMSVISWYMFYKNVACVLPQWWFGLFALFSGQNFYFDGFYQVYNIAFTSLPILAFGTLDQDISAAYSLKFPQLYADGRQKQFFSARIFWGYIAEATITSIVIVFFAIGSFSLNMEIDGKGLFIWDLGTAVMFAVVLIVNLRLMYEAKSYNWIFVFTTALCTLSFFVIFKIFSVTGLGLWDNINGVLGSFEPILGMSSFWLYLVVVVVAAWTIFFTQLSMEVMAVAEPVPTRIVIMERQHGLGPDESEGPVPLDQLSSEMAT